MRKKAYESINICFSTDDNYAKYLAVAIVSLLQSKEKTSYYHIYIVSQISHKNKSLILNVANQHSNNKIEFVALSSSEKKGYTRHGTLALARLMLPELLQDIDRVIWLDVDTLVLGDLKELFQTDFHSNAILGVAHHPFNYYENYLKECFDPTYHGKAISSGVMLMNLKKLRETKLLSQCLSFIDKFKNAAFMADQDAINVVCQHMIGFLKPEYNVTTVDYQMNNLVTKKARIVHFDGFFKPWLDYSLHPATRQYLTIAKFSNICIRLKPTTLNQRLKHSLLWKISKFVNYLPLCSTLYTLYLHQQYKALIKRSHLLQAIASD